jgi:predicted dehydrogenase
MAHWHALGYKGCADTRIVALADRNPDRASAFLEEHGGERTYTDYREMLERERLDIVSICTWPRSHAEMVAAAAEAGVVAIHCEKPMALSYADSAHMTQICSERRVQLTFNHHRRFLQPFVKARDMLRSRVIGDLLRIEASGENLFDWGTHWFDIMFFFNSEQPAEWVLGQVDWRGGKVLYGVTVEGHGLSHVRFQNGVEGLVMTRCERHFSTSATLVGSEGMIVMSDAPSATLRVRGKGDGGWRVLPCEEGFYSMAAVPRGIHDLVDALKTGREPELSARRALQATELIFATYESSRRRGRVDLPLQLEAPPPHPV